MLKAKLAEAENGSRPGRDRQSQSRSRAGRSRSGKRPGHARPHTRPGATKRCCPSRRWTTRRRVTTAPSPRWIRFDRAYELVRLGPRKEEIDALRAQVQQAQGTLDYAQVQLDNTVIRAPIDGTILERNVEKGEFVTTGFVGDKGAKGYVVSMAESARSASRAGYQPERFRANSVPRSPASSPPTLIRTASTKASSAKFRPKPIARRPPSR